MSSVSTHAQIRLVTAAVVGAVLCVAAWWPALSVLTAAYMVQPALSWPERSGVQVAIIPARYQSSRFPGKPLALIAGKPMIQRTWDQAKSATTLTDVYVATDDDRIRETCEEFGAKVLMTSPNCPNGTARCAEAALALGSQFDLVLNIQGDEPLLEPAVIDAVVRTLQEAPQDVRALLDLLEVKFSTACTPLKRDEVPMLQRVKVVTDKDGYALYFSRGAIPSNKDGAVRDFPEPFQEHPYLLHLGIVCLDAQFLQQYAEMPATPLMLMEDLEQLKVLENGYKVKVVTVDHAAFGVDKPEDVPTIEERLRQMQRSDSALAS